MRVFPILLISFLSFSLNAQQYYVYSISSEGQKKELIRKENYKNGLIAKKEFVGEDGVVNYFVRYFYNADDQLIKQIETYTSDRPYDIVREFSHDEKGRKVGELFGNNRTGKWGFYRFTYDASNRLDSTFVFAKNGDLTGYRLTEFIMDSDGNLTSEIRKKRSVEDSKSRITGVMLYEQLAPNRLKTITQAYDGSIVMIEDVLMNEQQNPTKIIKATEEEHKEIIFYYYDKNNRLNRSENFLNGEPESTTTYKYDSNDLLIETRYQFSNGAFSGEIYSLSSNEVLVKNSKTSTSKKEVNSISSSEVKGKFYDGFAWVKMDHKRYYYVDESGKPLIHYSFDRCYDFSEGLARVTDFYKAKDYRGTGFINTSGEVAIPLHYDKATDFKDGKAQVWMNGESWWIDQDGNRLN